MLPAVSGPHFRASKAYFSVVVLLCAVLHQLFLYFWRCLKTILERERERCFCFLFLSCLLSFIPLYSLCCIIYCFSTILSSLFSVLSLLSSLFADLSCYCFCRCWHIMLKRIYYTIYFLSPSLCLSSLSLLPPPRRWGANSTHECAKHRTPSNTQHLGRRDARSVKYFIIQHSLLNIILNSTI